MPWPTAQDYNEAIQNPHVCFDDNDLRGGKPEYKPLPRPIGGNFASVYRMQCGQQNWAVKCFLREYLDQQQHYESISRHLASVRIPYTVRFEFLPKGIMIKGQWYPILKMEWIEGELLDQYIKRNLYDSSVLTELANLWTDMTQCLQTNQIAHGDLQHGNVIVTDGSLRLIDYDGMFVPSLTGRGSNEIGHPNYQHPRRSGSDFELYIDNFASWVIYISIVCLSRSPELWDKIGAGEEFLLFRKNDFEQPDISNTLFLLASHSDPYIQNLTTKFLSMLYLNPKDIPPLENSQNKIKIFSGSGEWIKDHLEKKADPVSQTQSNIIIDSSWVDDFIEETDPKTFDNSVFVPRIIAFLSVMLIIASALNFPLSYFAFFVFDLIFLNYCVMLSRYKRESVLIQKQDFEKKLNWAKNKSSFTKQLMDDKENLKKKLYEEETEKKNALSKRRTDFQSHERTELNNLQAQIKNQIDSISKRRTTINKEEADALKRLHTDITAKLANIDHRISLLLQHELQEISNALTVIQDKYISNSLQKYKIADAHIDGIGAKYKERLNSKGFFTAADINSASVQRVYGIGHIKGKALEDWRKTCENKVKATMPTSLDYSELMAIKSKYASKKVQYENQKSVETQRRSSEEYTIKERYKKEGSKLHDEHSVVQTKFNLKRQQIISQYAQKYTVISQELIQIENDIRQKYQKIDNEMIQLAGDWGKYNREIRNIERELRIFKNISFNNYVRFHYKTKRHLTKRCTGQG